MAIELMSFPPSRVVKMSDSSPSPAAIPPILPEYPEFSCAAVVVAGGQSSRRRACAQGLALGWHEHASRLRFAGGTAGLAAVVVVGPIPCPSPPTFYSPEKTHPSLDRPRPFTQA